MHPSVLFRKQYTWHTIIIDIEHICRIRRTTPEIQKGPFPGIGNKTHHGMPDFHALYFVCADEAIQSVANMDVTDVFNSIQNLNPGAGVHFTIGC